MQLQESEQQADLKLQKLRSTEINLPEVAQQ